MNGEVRIWDARKSDVPLYEEIVQPHGLMGLAVHSGAPVIARCVCLYLREGQTDHSTSAPNGHSQRQRLVIQGFSRSDRPKTLSTIGIPLATNQHGQGPFRPSGFMPSAASLVFHPVSRH